MDMTLKEFEKKWDQNRKHPSKFLQAIIEDGRRDYWNWGKKQDTTETLLKKAREKTKHGKNIFLTEGAHDFED